MNSKIATNTKKRSSSTKPKRKKGEQPKHHRDYVGIIYHAPDFTPIKKSQIFISLMATNRADDFRTCDCATIDIMSDGDHLYHKNSRFRMHRYSRSVLLGRLWCPIIAKKLRSVEQPKEDWEDPEYVQADCGTGRINHFGRHSGEGPCETFQLIRLWNQFEDQGLSWEDRSRLITGRSNAEDLVGDLKNECERAGLVFGQKTRHEKQFREFDKLLGKLEAMFWRQVQTEASIALKNVEKYA